MSKVGKKKKNMLIDLRERSDIKIESLKTDQMSHEELIARLKRINQEIRFSNPVTEDMEFMIIEPKLEAIKKMRTALKARLTLLGMIDANRKKKYQK